MGRTYNYNVDRLRACAGCGAGAHQLDLGYTFELLEGEHVTESGYLVEVTEPLWEYDDCSSPESVRVVLCGEAHPGRTKGCFNMNGVVDKFLNNERLIRAYLF